MFELSFLCNSIISPDTHVSMRIHLKCKMHISVNRSTVLDEVAATNYTHRTPIGVAGLICPWNLPLYLLTFKIAPALAAGNTVVCKPSEMTSLTAHMLAGVMKDVGGFVNVFQDLYSNIFMLFNH